MSTPMLYHLFGLRDCTFTKFTIDDSVGVISATVKDTSGVVHIAEADLPALSADRQATGRRQAGGRQAKAYYLKEDLRQIWEQKNKSAAKAILKRWIAAAEGTNNKIGAIRRASYGLRDMEFFKLKIYACKNVRYSLVG